MPAPRRVSRVLLALMFFFSGAFALIYEVIWQRQFALLFGSGAPATAIVLAAYFAGLGLGSFAFGRWRPEWKALKTYAVFELAVAAGALLVTPVVAVYAAWYPHIISVFAQNGVALLATKSVLAFAAVVIPTAAMGGTLPTLAELVDAGNEHLGLNVGWLYAVNTAGAALGAAAFPFILLRLLGSHGTVLFCATGNLVIAGVAFWMSKGWVDMRGSPKPETSRKSGMQPRVVLLLAFLSGAGTFALQVLWNRAFAQVHENSIYSFALIAIVFIAAIAFGAQAARLLLRRGVSIERSFGVGWIVGGIAVGFSPALFVKLTNGLAYLDGRASWSGLAVKGASMIMVPVALLSLGLPLLLERAGDISQRRGGEIVGTILAVNIGGSIIGALLAGFALPAWIGLWNAMIATGAMFAIAGVWLFWKASHSRLVAIVAVGVLGWLQQRTDLPRVRIEAKRGESLLGLEEGAYGIAAVTERAGSRRLKLNNHYTLGGTFATGDERLQAHIPLLLHAAPRRGVFLGFGTGITAGGALFHSNLSVQAVELVPEVSELAARHFAEGNGGFHGRANTKVVINDARNFLRATEEKFDVIVSDIVVPWQPGESALYTVEYFEAAKRSLNTNGVFCAWVPAFQMGEGEFNILVRTFLSVFGRVQVWRGDFSPTRPALGLVGTDMPLDAQVIQRRMAEMADDPANPHLRDARGMWMYFVGVVRSEDIEERRINSEDRPWLELFAPWRERRGGSFVGRKLAEWESRLTPETERWTSELSADAASGYKGGRMMVEWTQAMSQGNQLRASEIQGRMRRVLGDETYRLIFGLP
jgi:spermidine synthase